MEDLNAPALKGDIKELRQEMAQLGGDLRQEMAQLGGDLRQEMAQLRSEMSHQYRDVVERMDDNMTRLLKAFCDVAESNTKRIGMVETSDSSTRLRLGTPEDRVMAVEKRLNLPAA